MRINGHEITEKMIHPFEVEEELDGRQWGVWKCEVETPDGEIHVGYVQSDGHMHAVETLEMEE